MSTFWEIVTNLFTTPVILGILVFLFRTPITSWVDARIQHIYDQKMFRLETEKEIRFKAEIIAELLSEWSSEWADPEKGKIDYVKLNRLTFQAFLWLPPDLARSLSRTLNYDKSVNNTMSILCEVRKHLIGMDDDLRPEEIAYFQKKPNGTVSHVEPTG